MTIYDRGYVTKFFEKYLWIKMLKIQSLLKEFEAQIPIQYVIS